MGDDDDDVKKSKNGRGAQEQSVADVAVPQRVGSVRYPSWPLEGREGGSYD